MADPTERITEEDDVYRRLVSFQVNPDGTANSAAFEPRKGETGISVEVARLTTEGAARSRAGDEFGLGRLSAAVPLSLELQVAHDPKPDQYFHAEIRGPMPKSKRRILAEKTQVFKLPGER